MLTDMSLATCIESSIFSNKLHVIVVFSMS